jgi:hypothetical protein
VHLNPTYTTLLKLCHHLRKNNKKLNNKLMIAKNRMRELMPHKGIDKLIQFLDESVWSPSSTHEGDHTTKPISMEEIAIATEENNISKKENDITMDVDFFK